MDDQLILECSRSLLTENKLSEDLSLEEDILLVFFTVSSRVVGSDENLIDWKRGANQDSGEDIISLFTYSDTAADVQTLKEFSSINFSLDRFRPDPDGEARCRMFKVPRSARFYKGYIPAVTGFNGDNGLIRSIIMFQCSPGSQVTGNEKCDRFSDQCREVVFN